MKRTLIAVAVLGGGFLLAGDDASFLLGAITAAVAGFLVLLSAGEKRAAEIVVQTQERCKDELVAYAEGMAAAPSEVAEEPAFPRDGVRRRASDVLGAWA